MKTDFDLPNPYLLGSVVFRPEFNSHEQALSANQAWSLFFTAGKEDKALGYNAEAGRLFTNLLLAIAASGAIWAVLFTHSV